MSSRGVRTGARGPSRIRIRFSTAHAPELEAGDRLRDGPLRRPGYFTHHHGEDEMVNRRGQATAEWILMLAFFTLIGVFLMKYLAGPSNSSNAIGKMSQNAATNIAKD